MILDNPWSNQATDIYTAPHVLLDKVHFTLTRASGYRIVDLFPPRFYDNVQIRRPGVGVVDIVKPSDVDRDDSDQEDVHVTQARIVIVTALSMSRD